MTSRILLLAVAGLVLGFGVVLHPGNADGRAPRLPQGSKGIAANYPGDAGIEKDPKVVFVETFAGTLPEITARWEDVLGEKTFALATDVPKGASGTQSLLMTHIGGEESRNHLYRRIEPGLEQMFARFYVKFDKDCAPVHHFGTHIGGNNPSTKWPMMDAGNAPAGDKHFNASIEPFGKSWTWDYYTYWCEMRGSPPNGKRWGNVFVRDPKLEVERGKWICVEMMVKMNDPEDTNGELALWIDGKRVSHLGKGFPVGTWTFDKFTPGKKSQGVTWDHEQGARRSIRGGLPFEGFRWRTVKELNANYVWLSLYMTHKQKGHISKVHFDNVVLAKEYIGPIQKPRR
ncbi:MAG: hypothetical protein GY946_19260 [bacterium]|nr:hypothetical protein [bacterium]